MRQFDQVAQLERLLGLVRTNTRDDAPGLSHAPVRSSLSIRGAMLRPPNPS